MMSRNWAAAAALVAAATVLAQVRKVEPLAKPTSAAEIRESLRLLAVDLRDARVLASAVTDTGLKGRLTQAIAQAEARVADLERRLGTAVADAPPAAMTPDEFARVLAAMEKEAFDDRKLPVLKDALRYKGMSCEQATRAVKAFRFGAGQKAAAVAIHPRLTDPINFPEVLAAITFESDRQDVRKALGLK